MNKHDGDVNMPLLLLPALWMVAELLGMIVVAGRIGALATIALLFLGGVAGLLLIRGQQFSMLAQLAASGRQSAEAMREGGFRVFAGILLMIPGFLSDALALVFLVPPLRRVFGALLLKVFAPLAAQATVYRGSQVFDYEAERSAQDDDGGRIIEGEVVSRDDDK